LEEFKVKCECGWQGMAGEMISGDNPFDPSQIIYACPKCKTLESTTFRACDEPDCWWKVTCGTPTPVGYRSTCGKHMPKKEKAPGD